MDQPEKRCIKRLEGVLDGRPISTFMCTCRLCSVVLPKLLDFAMNCQAEIARLDGQINQDKKKLIVVP